MFTTYGFVQVPFTGLEVSYVDDGGAGASAEVIFVNMARTNWLWRNTFSLPIVDGTNLSSSAFDNRKLRKLDRSPQYCDSFVGPRTFTKLALSSCKLIRGVRCIGGILCKPPTTMTSSLSRATASARILTICLQKNL